MNIVYFSHSYRKEDNYLVNFFGKLIQSQDLVLTLDPPSETVNAAKLERHLNSTDGMVAILSWREGGVSNYILYEISMCLRARKPLLVFVEDNLDTKTFSSRVLQKRFSRGYLPREIKEHNHAIQSLKAYMSTMPIPTYQPSIKKRACLLIGSSILSENTRKIVNGLIKKRNYSLLEINEITNSTFQKQSVYETICIANLAICFIDSKLNASHFIIGVVRTAMLPTIFLTTNSSYDYEPGIPMGFQPNLINTEDVIQLEKIINREIDLFEENLFNIVDNKMLDSYTELLFKHSSPIGKYDAGTYNIFARELNMRDQYVISGGQMGSIGPNGHIHDNSFNQIWNETKDKVDLKRLAEELETLQLKLKEEAKTPENYYSIGNIAEAESSAKKGDGPKTFEYLRKAGKWALDVAQEISVPVATEVFKKLLGL